MEATLSSETLQEPHGATSQKAAFFSVRVSPFIFRFTIANKNM
jgi:hypothetical protein